jgi:hypothetical protein
MQKYNQKHKYPWAENKFLGEIVAFIGAILLIYGSVKYYYYGPEITYGYRWSWSNCIPVYIGLLLLINYIMLRVSRAGIAINNNYSEYMGSTMDAKFIMLNLLLSLVATVVLVFLISLSKM